MELRDSRLEAAQKAIDSIGLGFDITQDIYFHNCKRSSRLIIINDEIKRNLEIPGGLSIPNVPLSIKCLKGESLRIHSDLLSFLEMKRHLNKEMCLESQYVSGHFCASFGLDGHCIKNFGAIRSLSYDGWFIKRYTIELERYPYHGELDDLVKEVVPSLWDPEALARFIKQFGTHVVVGVSMGGKDVLYLRESLPSNLQYSELQKLLMDKADERFIMNSSQNDCLPSEDLHNNGKNVVVINIRRGGSSEKLLHHKEWLNTVELEPDVISMFFLPLTSILKGIPGNGFLIHAINLYLRYKPPIEDLHQFLEFQLPKHWAPVLKDISLGSRRKHQLNTWLRFSFFGPKLYINTIPVDVGTRPVTGLRLHLEGTRSNRLAIHLLHLTSLPMFFPLSDNQNAYLSSHSCNSQSHQKVKWNRFSYVCTAPVESEDALSIVTGAQLQVENKCLFLRLRFSKVVGATSQKKPEWESSVEEVVGAVSQKKPEWASSVVGLSRKCRGIITSLFSKEKEGGGPKPGDVTIGSSTYSAERPAPVHAPKLLRFVDATEKMRGPEDYPGYWVVSGARLCVQNGKIFLMVKYSLLSLVNVVVMQSDGTHVDGN